MAKWHSILPFSKPAKSLLIIGFPRGFTSPTWNIVRRATGLKDPGVSAGEVLNKPRVEKSGNEWLKAFMLSKGTMYDKYYSTDETYYPYHREILDRFVEGGYCIKDVTQPFFILRYLAEHPGAYNVLFVDRPLEQVLDRLLRLGWAPRPHADLVRFLYRSFVSFPVVDALYDAEVLFSAVERLGYKVQRYDYFSKEFIAKRESMYKDKEFIYSQQPPAAASED